MKRKQGSGEVQVASFTYDYEDDVFYIRPVERTYDHTVPVSGLLFDVDASGKIVGLEIPNAAQVFNVPKLHLRNTNRGLTVVNIVADAAAIRIEIKMQVAIRNAKQAATLSVEKIRPDMISPTSLQLAEAF